MSLIPLSPSDRRVFGVAGSMFVLFGVVLLLVGFLILLSTIPAVVALIVIPVFGFSGGFAMIVGCRAIIESIRGSYHD